MAQDISGTSLAANTAATVRSPIVEVLFDWANDGYGSEGAWTDETAYLVSARGNSRAVGWGRSIAGMGTGVADVAYLTLRNPEESGGSSGLRFSPTNSNGSLYGNIGEGEVRGKRARLRVGFHDAVNGDEFVPVLVGYVEDLSEQYAARTVEIELRDRAAVAVRSRPATTLQTDVMVDAYLETIAALIDRDAPDAGDRAFDNGLDLLPYAWCEGDRLWAEMGMVAESQGGRIWYDHAGVLRFQDATHFIKSRTNSWENPLTSQFTFTVDDFRECNPRYDRTAVANHVIVEYRPKYVSVLQVVYTASETFIVPPSDSVTIRCEHRYPVDSISALVADTDYLAGTAGGTDITDDISVSETTKAGYTDLQISNGNSDYAAYLYKLQIRGYPLLAEQSIQYEAEDNTSIGTFGRQTVRVSNPYIQSYRHAQSLGDLLLARFKDPPLLLDLLGVPGVPYLEPGDRVTVTESLTDIDTDFFIGEIDWRFEAGFTQTLRLVRASDMYPHTNYFLVGTSDFGDGDDADDGRLFW